MAVTRKRVWIVPAVFSLIVAALWVFPKAWYTKQGAEQAVWFAEQTEIPGWAYTSTPVDEAAERVLVADRTVNGEFRRGASAIRVFSAKRYEEKPNEIGLFVHTPDRCWSEGGWRIEPTAPDLVEMTVHGVRMAMERRLFVFKEHKELVYFCGLLGGQTLPYRLDHNLSVGMRTALKNQNATAARASDAHFWKRLWTSFASRRALSGPKQFVRVSTSVQDNDAKAADALLQQFLAEWLVPGNYGEERAAMRVAARKQISSSGTKVPF
jgi:hypothetical protein